MEKILARGAEAVIIKEKDRVIKDRIPKPYRIQQLDEKLRKLRTRAEARLLEKAHAIIPVPKIMNRNETLPNKPYEITIEYIHGKKLADNLEKLNYQQICNQIGNSLAKLHDAGIIHGDLTTSNMIYNEKNKKVYFIDFGLGFHSHRIEDKAVDLHLIKEALEARHPSIYEEAFKLVLEGYKTSQDHMQVLKQLEKVERRGRYKVQY